MTDTKPEYDEKLKTTITRLIDLFDEISNKDIDVLIMVVNRDGLSLFHSSNCPRCMAELLVESLDANNIKHEDESEDNLKIH